MELIPPTSRKLAVTVSEKADQREHDWTPATLKTASNNVHLLSLLEKNFILTYVIGVSGVTLHHYLLWTEVSDVAGFGY